MGGGMGNGMAGPMGGMKGGGMGSMGGGMGSMGGGMGPKGKGGPKGMPSDMPCRYGVNCVRIGCMFQHPAGYTPGPGMQKGAPGMGKGSGKANGSKGDKGAKGTGPQNWFGKADEPCKFGDKCTRPG